MPFFANAGRKFQLHHTRKHRQNENVSSSNNYKVYDNILQAIGNTPLVRLNRIPAENGLQCEIYVKCEFMNPGGSIKDRIGYSMLVNKEESGSATPGVTHLVEPTSGNTGIGIGLSGAVKGYKCTFVTEDKNSDDKLNTLRILHSNVVMAKSNVPMDNPDSEFSIVKKIKSKDQNAIELNQFENCINPKTHHDITALEILEALGGVDMVAVGAGTGGTITGVGSRCKNANPDCLVVVADPDGSIMAHKGVSHPFYVEGIGGNFVPAVFDRSVVDYVHVTTDEESFVMARRLARAEGLLCGGSSGAAMVAAIHAAKKFNLGAGKRIVVILSDGIRNYMSKFVKDQWMEALLFKRPPNNDTLPFWNTPITEITLKTKFVSVYETNSCDKALAAMEDVDVAAVTDADGKFLGAVSRDSLRHKVCDPDRKSPLKFSAPVSECLVRDCFRLARHGRRGVPTLGLLSRVLDLAPFVIIGEDHNDEDGKLSHFVADGVATSADVLDFVINMENLVHHH